MSASRFDNFTCDCCWTDYSQNFCISMMCWYILLSIVFTGFTVFFITQRQKGKAQQR